MPLPEGAPSGRTPAARPALVLLALYLLPAVPALARAALAGASRAGDLALLAGHLVVLALALHLARRPRRASAATPAATPPAPRRAPSLATTDRTVDPATPGPATRVTERPADGSAPSGTDVAGAGAAWLALAAVPLCYAGLPRVAAGLAADPARPAPLHDATVLAWERRLFAGWPGGSPVVALPAWLDGRWGEWLASEALHLAYLAYYAVIYLPPALLWWRAVARGRAGAPRPNARARARAAARAFAADTCTLTLAFVLCYAVFALWPVAGPRYLWPPAPTLPDGPVRGLVLALLEAGSSRGTAFPSSHVAVSVAQTVALARLAPPLAWPVAVATAGLAVGAVLGGFHWGVDVLAGAVVGVGAGWAGPRLWARWCGVPLPAPRAAHRTTG